MAESECGTLKLVTRKELELYTNNFSQDNLIGNFQRGSVYRGYICGQQVTVKKWRCPFISEKGENEARLKDEILLLQHSEIRTHPNLVSAIEYCCVEGSEDQLGIVYDVTTLDSVENLVTKDSFTWLQRIKVILGFASILESMHSATPPSLPYLIRNISAAHVLVDKDYNPKLFDFGAISGGIFPDRRRDFPFADGCSGYKSSDQDAPGFWSEKVDTSAFAQIIYMLMSKKPVLITKSNGVIDTIDRLLRLTYKPRGSFVHKSFTGKPGFLAKDGRKLTKLALGCTGYLVTMKEVVECLLSLRVVKRYADFFGVKQIVCRRSHLTW